MKNQKQNISIYQLNPKSANEISKRNQQTELANGMEWNRIGKQNLKMKVEDRIERRNRKKESENEIGKWIENRIEKRNRKKKSEHRIGKRNQNHRIYQLNPESANRIGKWNQ